MRHKYIFSIEFQNPSGISSVIQYAGTSYTLGNSKRSFVFKFARLLLQKFLQVPRTFYNLTSSEFGTCSVLGYTPVAQKEPDFSPPRNAFFRTGVIFIIDLFFARQRTQNFSSSFLLH